MFEGLIVTEREMKYATLDTESLAYSYPLKNIQIKTFYTWAVLRIFLIDGWEGSRN